MLSSQLTMRWKCQFSWNVLQAQIMPRSVKGRPSLSCLEKRFCFYLSQCCMTLINSKLPQSICVLTFSDNAWSINVLCYFSIREYFKEFSFPLTFVLQKVERKVSCFQIMFLNYQSRVFFSIARAKENQLIDKKLMVFYYA